MGGEISADRATAVLDHPVRRQIIESLGRSGPMAWKDLSAAAGVSTGSLYHHVDVLEGIVARDPERRYVLTGKGMVVYKFLQSESSVYDKEKVAKLFRRTTAGSVAVSVFAPRAFIARIGLTRRRAVVASVVAILPSLAVAFAFRTQLRLVASVAGQDPLLSFAWLGATVGILCGGVYLASRIWGVPASLGTLVPSVCLTLLPLDLFSFIVWLTSTITRQAYAGGAIAPTLLLVVLQAWSMGILAAGMSVSTGLRLERTLTWSLLIVYASTVAMLLSGVRVA